MENGGGKQHTEVEIRLDMLRSQCERRRGGIKERRGGSLEETDVRAAMFTKEERREGMEGGLVQGTRRGRREPTGCQEKEKRTVLKDGECSTMLRPHEKGKLKGLTQMAFTGHEA